MATGGTDNHIVLLDMRQFGLTGSKVSSLLERCSIIANKNAWLGDTSALSPSGVRLGSPAMTTRGLKEQDFEKVAELFDAGVKMARRIQDQSGATKLKAFEQLLDGNREVQDLRCQVEEFCSRFPLPSVELREGDDH